VIVRFTYHGEKHELKDVRSIREDRVTKEWRIHTNDRGNQRFLKSKTLRLRIVK